ncbi:DUF222 domain-containing protein [Lentzea atacamensis]|uniref:DUF222 domain-containing protein n=1 Tax=Lentzea atacamensis TaxID=531938 RepID=UPI0014737AD1|nr:DUF222 domain-containing protein [Lentzea atacamensis]
MDRRGAAAELGYQDLPHVLRHAVRWDRKTARQWVTRAALLVREITPTGSVLEPELPVVAAAVAEGALSIEHVAVVAEVMNALPAEVEAPVVGFAREYEPSAVRAFGKELAYRLFQNITAMVKPSGKGQCHAVQPVIPGTRAPYVPTYAGDWGLTLGARCFRIGSAGRFTCPAFSGR